MLGQLCLQLCFEHRHQAFIFFLVPALYTPQRTELSDLCLIGPHQSLRGLGNLARGLIVYNLAASNYFLQAHMRRLVLLLGGRRDVILCSSSFTTLPTCSFHGMHFPVFSRDWYVMFSIVTVFSVAV